VHSQTGSVWELNTKLNWMNMGAERNKSLKYMISTTSCLSKVHLNNSIGQDNLETLHIKLN